MTMTQPATASTVGCRCGIWLIDLLSGCPQYRFVARDPTTPFGNQFPYPLLVLLAHMIDGEGAGFRPRITGVLDTEKGVAVAACCVDFHLQQAGRRLRRFGGDGRGGKTRDGN